MKASDRTSEPDLRSGLPRTYVRTYELTERSSHLPEIAPSSVTRTRTYGISPLDQECIRRDHSVWTTCPCEPCRVDRSRTSKLKRLGHLPRASSAQATVQILSWEREGFTPAWTASACGIPTRYVENLITDLRSNRARAIGPRRAAQILTADITAATTGKRTAVGTGRRLRALAWLGYDGTTISAHTGLSLMAISVHQRSTAERVSAHHWHAVREFYDRVGLTPGPSPLAARRARRLGWDSPLAWDDDAIESPTAERVAS